MLNEKFLDRRLDTQLGSLILVSHFQVRKAGRMAMMILRFILFRTKRMKAKCLKLCGVGDDARSKMYQTRPFVPSCTRKESARERVLVLHVLPTNTDHDYKKLVHPTIHHQGEIDGAAKYGIQN